MSKVISKTIKIISPQMPPRVDFIEQEIQKLNLDPIRWAIVEIEENELTISFSALQETIWINCRHI